MARRDRRLPVSGLFDTGLRPAVSEGACQHLCRCAIESAAAEFASGRSRLDDMGGMVSIDRPSRGPSASTACEQLYEHSERGYGQSGRRPWLVRIGRSSSEDGSLVRFGKAKVLAPGAFYVTWNDHRKLSDAVELLKAWLIKAGAATLTGGSYRRSRLESKSRRT